MRMEGTSVPSRNSRVTLSSTTMSASVPQRRWSRLGKRPRTGSQVTKSIPAAGSCTPCSRRPCHGRPTATERGASGCGASGATASESGGGS
jgi:hypothetical protein